MEKRGVVVANRHGKRPTSRSRVERVVAIDNKPTSALRRAAKATKATRRSRWNMVLRQNELAGRGGAKLLVVLGVLPLQPLVCCFVLMARE